MRDFDVWVYGFAMWLACSTFPGFALIIIIGVSVTQGTELWKGVVAAWVLWSAGFGFFIFRDIKRIVDGDRLAEVDRIHGGM